MTNKISFQSHSVTSSTNERLSFNTFRMTKQNTLITSSLSKVRGDEYMRKTNYVDQR